MSLTDHIDSVREDAKSMSTKQLAEKYNVCRDHMYRTLREYGIRPYRAACGRYWTKDDYHILSVCAGKISIRGIAKLLNRTIVAIESKCQVLGISYCRYRMNRRQK